MDLTFYKYHGTGNDFVMIDNREKKIKLSTKEIKNICHRRFGVGADGLILLQNTPEANFKMVYYNADGNQSTMCGNGGRCIVKFAQQLGIIQNKATFIAIDGLHEATIDEDGRVSLKMINTPLAEEKNGGMFVNTGSPHHVKQVDDVTHFDVFSEGKKLRNAYGAEGSNVNFVEILNDGISVRTYERGVEDETYSCGTGVTASAIIAYQNNWIDTDFVSIKTPGGALAVSFTKSKNGYENVWLHGPAQFVYNGKITV